ncbi:MAG TPA: SRPBCC family protein [Noviherbaspirillum sp.]
MCRFTSCNYQLITTWCFRSPLQPVFDTLFDSLRWPEWWPGVEMAEELFAGNADGTESIRRYHWKSLLPYRLSFDATAARIEPPFLLEGTVNGDLRGRARCLLAHSDGITSVRFEWYVRTTKAWMNLLAPMAHMLFAYNHRMLMERGARALAGRLGVELLAVEYNEQPLEQRRPVDD